MKALIIEDDVMSQCVLAKLLTERGHEVVSFENAEQAILAYQRDFYPLVCVAAELPGMDGLQFSRWIRSQANGDRVFIIVGTSPTHPADLNLVLEAGANDFMAKPFELSAIRARLTIAEKQMDQFFSQTRLRQALEVESTEKVRLATELEEMLGTFEQRSQEYETQLVTAREICDTETGQRRKLEAELDATRRDLARQIAELEARLQQTRESLAGEQQNRAELQTRLTQLEAEPPAVGQLAALETQLQQTRESLTDEQKKSADLQTRLTQLETESAEARRVSESVRAELESRLSAEVAARQQTEASVRAAEELLDDSIQAHTRALGEVTAALEEAIQHRAQIAVELDQARRDLEARQRQHQQDQALADRTLQELNARVEAETCHRIEAEERLAALRSSRATLADEAQQELARARQRNVEDLERIDSLTEELGRLTEMAKRLTEETALHRDARRHVTARYHALARLSLQVNEVQTPAELGRLVAERARDLVGWDDFRFDAYSTQTNRLTPVAQFNTRTDFGPTASRVEADNVPEGLLQRVLAQGPQLIVQPPLADPENTADAPLQRARSNSTLCVPVRYGDRVSGFISLGIQAFNAYSPEDVEAATVLAAQAAIGLERLGQRELPGHLGDRQTEFAPARF